MTTNVAIDKGAGAPNMLTNRLLGSYEVLVIYLEQLSLEVADLFGLSASWVVLVLVLVIFTSEKWQTSSVWVLAGLAV